MDIFHGIEWLPESRPPKQLYILLHGAGASPADLLPLARKLRDHYPDAAILLPDGVQPYEGSDYRRQWYAMSALTEENRPARVAEVIPFLYEIVKDAQDRLSVLPPDTALIGFSQGATLSLEFSKVHDGCVGRIIAFSGRYARLPEKAPELTTIHLLHGENDRVIPAVHARSAYEQLSILHGDVTLDIASSVSHELHAALIERAITRLETCVPLRSWERALGLK
jgi:phospholipase/carboxylesterase